MGSCGGRARGADASWGLRWSLTTLFILTLASANALPTQLHNNDNSADKGAVSTGGRSSDLMNTNASETGVSSNSVKESDSSEKQISLPSSEVSEAPLMDQEPMMESINGDERVTRLDYYDDMQLPKDSDEDDTPVLPEHAVNVNEDYAGIYDYRGLPDGRYRRKRTLTTNIEQLLTRSARLNRMRRSASDNSLSDSVSPGERAEILVSLFRVLQEADPAFDANDFLKVLHAPSVSMQDLDYLIYLSNIVALTDPASLTPRSGEHNFEFRQRNFEGPGIDPVQLNPNDVQWSQLTLPELIELGRIQQQKQQQRQQLPEPFYLTSDLLRSDEATAASKRDQGSKSSSTSSKDFSRLFAIAAMMAQQQEDPTGIAM